MVNINKNRILMMVCMIISVTLCVGHISGNKILIVLSMALFLGEIIFTSLSGKSLYLIYFFLPWAPLIKFEPGVMSIYTIGLIGVCVITWIRHRKFFYKQIFIAIALIIFILIVRLFYEFEIDNTFIMFSIMLMLFPIVCKDMHEVCDFYDLNSFFSVGIISAALAAYFLAKYPMIGKFIDVYSWSKITRYSGFYGDSNFYSAHISAAMAGILILFLDSPKKPLRFMVIAALLLYCGLISASKAFVITIAVIFLLWILSVFSIHRDMSNKIIIIITVVIITIGIVVSGAFDDVFNIIAFRFKDTTDLSNLTTGRSDIWAAYMQYILSNPEIFLFGRGYVNVILEETGYSTHNTLLQSIYQFGIVGFAMLVFWLKNLFKITLPNLKIKHNQYLSCIILIVGVFLPWLSIDLLFFDELFLMMFYVSLGFKWISRRSDNAI